jgi:hypothetical protein
LENQNIPDAELNSSLCSSDNEILNLQGNKRPGKLRKREDLSAPNELNEKQSENKKIRKNSKTSGKQNDIEIEGEDDDFIAQNEHRAPSKSLAHTIFTREKTAEEKKLEKMQVIKTGEIVTAELEAEYLTLNDQGIVSTDIPERILLRYLNKYVFLF